MNTPRPGRRRFLAAIATLTALALSACGQIYPSSEPAQGPANGVKADVDEVVVGFAQQPDDAIRVGGDVATARLIGLEQLPEAHGGNRRTRAHHRREGAIVQHRVLRRARGRVVGAHERGERVGRHEGGDLLGSLLGVAARNVHR